LLAYRVNWGFGEAQATIIGILRQVIHLKKSEVVPSRRRNQLELVALLSKLCLSGWKNNHAAFRTSEISRGE
jgi:hypothetical protein